MEGIRDKVAIIGMGCCKFGENWNKSVEDMMIDAAYEAYEDAGVGPEDIQAAWFGTSHSGTSGLALSQPLHLPYMAVSRLENACATASDALRNACYGVAAGIYTMVMALGVEMEGLRAVMVMVPSSQGARSSTSQMYLGPPRGVIVGPVKV